MAGKKQVNKCVVERVIQKGWAYLDQHFAKFTTTQKIHIALELCKRSMDKEDKGQNLVIIINEGKSSCNSDRGIHIDRAQVAENSQSERTKV